MCAVSFFIAIIFLFYFLYLKTERYYLYMTVFSLGMCIWMFGFTGFSLYVIDARIVYNLITYIGSILCPIGLILFIHSFLNIPKNIFQRILLIYYFFNLIFVFFEIILTGGVFYFHQYFYMPYISSINIVIIYLIIITLYSIIKKKKYAFRIFIGIILITATTALGILDFLNIYRIETPMMESFFIMALLFTSALAQRFTQVHTDLETAHSDLLVLDRMKDDFLATTTHELRTPLHGIMGIAESMETGALGDLNPRQKENLELIRTSASRLNGLVNSILDFSKLRAGKADLFIEEVSIGDLAQSALSLLKPSADEKGLELRSEIGPLPVVKADRNRIYQIIFNLAGNAIKFTDTGSVVLRAGSKDGSVRVCVADTGPCIAPEDLGRIWSPFTQAESAETRHTVGTGLGLAITKHLVELHGGRIWAESEPGKGSTFCFELPLEPPAAGITRVSKAGDAAAPGAVAPVKEHLTFVTAANPEQARATILAVDDDPVNLRVLENICAECSYKLITTMTGPAALDILKHTEIDLVLLDLMLPGMSGYEVCQRIRGMEVGRYIPVIMVTALDQTGHMARGFKTGANDYVTKPFNRNELVMRIENQLAIKQMLDMEKTVVNGLRKEKDAISNMFQRSVDLKESALRMAEWEKIIKDDLAIARAFQAKLMSGAGKTAGLETSVTYLPLMEIGGDVYDIFEPRGGVMRVFLADATGHGITASLNTVKILSEYASVKEVMDTPAAVISYLNRRFIAERGRQQIVFACAVADIDLKSGTVRIATAGLPPQYLLRDGIATPIEPMNPIVGLSDKSQVREISYPFNPCDMLFLATDGLQEMEEAKSRPGNMVERDLLMEKIPRAYAGRGLEEGGAELLKLFGGKKRIVSDDVTFIAVRRTDGPAA
ncbi:MAG TPA: SpoIIE family protein phosphatase [Spirochaetota bacterium]|nr:SpoIIE family protein phosphatase [Spirochaetota bacterium]